MDTPASKKFTLKLGTGFQHAKVSNSTGSRYNKSTVGRLNELCAGLIDTVWDQSARLGALDAPGETIKT
ncbi:hypothetical protein AYI70_g11289, partial [Smittium culicis]